MSINSNEWSAGIESSRKLERERREEKENKKLKREQEDRALERLHGGKFAKVTILVNLFLRMTPKITSPRGILQGLRRRPIGDQECFRDMVFSLCWWTDNAVDLDIFDVSNGEDVILLKISESTWGGIECKINSSLKNSLPETAVWAINEFIPMLKSEAQAAGVKVEISFARLTEE